MKIRWLGTAGFVVETAETTVMIDPYLTRSRLRTLVARPLISDEGAVRSRLPRRLDAILCGHSHFDHLLDAPLIAKLKGAKLVGSPTTCAFGRAHGLPEDQLVEVSDRGANITVGDIEVRFVPSLHGRIVLGRVPFPGGVTIAPSLPARVWQYRMGGAFGILLTAKGTTVYHNGSADLVDANLRGVHADLLLVGIAGRSATRDYVKRLTGLLDPAFVVPTHHDAFFAPLDEGVHLLPGIEVEGFVDEVQQSHPRARVITPLYDEPLWCDGASQSAFLED
jgi:L-ascorbate metabolism protein UlaG (beta-lactamase superfamily)